MKEIYTVGTKVMVKSFEWYIENADENGEISILSPTGCYCDFLNGMEEFCGKEATITEANSVGFYLIDIDGGEFSWTNDMFED